MTTTDTKYPKISKVVSQPDSVDIYMENVVDGGLQGIPLTVSVVPHQGRIYIHFSGIGFKRISFENSGGNSTYISFVE